MGENIEIIQWLSTLLTLICPDFYSWLVSLLCMLVTFSCVYRLFFSLLVLKFDYASIESILYHFVTLAIKPKKKKHVRVDENEHQAISRV